MKIIIYIFLIAFTICWAVLKKEENVEGEKIDFSVFNRFLNVLGFCLTVFAYGWILFKADLFLWLCFYTGILVVLLIGLAEKEKRLKNWVTAIVLIVVIFCGFRVPTHPDSFQQWISENKQLYCPSDYDCVKVTTYIDAKGSLITKSEIVPITKADSNYYLLFVTGNFAYEDSNGKEVEYEGINIAGWWIETTN
nr:hypothetical protein [Fredinandcohnia onubensis]